jgi:integrase
MASLFKRPGSKKWVAAFTDENRKRWQRSTKMTDKKLAQKQADEWESEARNQRTILQIRRVSSEIRKEITGKALEQETIRAVKDRWINLKKAETRAATADFYDGALTRFLDHLGTRADRDLQEITRADAEAFRDALLKRELAAKTINHSLKVLKMFFRFARQEELIADDPTEFVKGVRADAEAKKRRPFSIPEIKAVLSVAGEEWQSLIKFGLFTGQRLADLASLTWRNLDLVAMVLRLVQRKTKKRIIIPLAGPLSEHVLALNAPDDPEMPVHPLAFGTLMRQGKVGGLSNQFASILSEAGLRESIPHRKTHGRGRGAGSSVEPLSFHSLRHSSVSFLKEAGVPAAVVMQLVGHESEVMSQHYTTVGAEALTAAVEKFPSLKIEA